MMILVGLKRMRTTRQNKRMALYHWSPSNPECFTSTPPEAQICFSPEARGRVYCVDDPFRRGGTTKKINARTLLIFTDEALKLFKKHPLFTLDGFKWFYGQYWTTKPGNIIWDACNARRSKGGNVWVINNARFITKEEINDSESKSQNKKQYYRNIFGGFVVAGVPLALFLLILAKFFCPNSFIVRFFTYISEYIGVDIICLLIAILVVMILALVGYNMTIRPIVEWNAEDEIREVMNRTSDSK